MTISTINSNLAAIAAQQNIGNATQAVQNETTALSSGNRIVHASTDVAALATGTALQSQVSALTTALTVASQGSSLLQVADGALAQVEAIIQQQQSIATSAQSGSLSDVQRGFLDQQFQQLTQQIDQLAGSTNFNGVSLINGSIQGGTNVNTTTATGNTVGSASSTIATIATLNTGNDTLTISIGGGPTLTFTSTTDGNASAGDVATGTTANTEAANFAAALNNSGDSQLANFHFTSDSSGNILATYVGSATTPANIPTITVGSNAAGGNVTLGGTSGVVTFGVASLANGATAAGTNGSGLIGVLTAGATATKDSVTVNGVTFSAVASGATSAQFNTDGTVTGTVTGLVTALNNSTSTALAGITFAADSTPTDGKIYAYYNGSTDLAVSISVTKGAGGAITASSVASNQTLTTVGSTGLAAGTTQAVGAATGNLFVSGGSNISSANNYGGAVDLSKIANNSSFTGAFGGTGTIGAITATYDAGTTTGTSGVTLSTVVGGITYTAQEVTNATLSGTGPNTVTFTGSNGNSAAGGSFSITLQGSQSNVTSQTGASQLAAALNSGLSSVTAYQNRSVTSFNNAYTTTVGSKQTATLQGASLEFKSSTFSNPIISAVTVTAPNTGSSDATITATINGQTYSTISGIGDTFNTNSQIVLQNTSNPSQQLILNTGTTAATGDASGVAIDVSSASNAAAFQATLTNALGLNSVGSGLSFQVGSTSADSIGVSIGSATTSSLFGGQTLDVKTITDATAASATLTNALNSVISLRSTVGALEQRFSFATSAASSAQQNEGAAESNLLDTDVASESTSFATSQVQLQAGIAVLAQANQLQQNLLKLL